jgi:hypothetical protein
MQIFRGIHFLVNLTKKQMKLFEDFKIKFERPDWSRDPELGLIDTILEQHPHLIALFYRKISCGDRKRASWAGKIPPVLNRS